MNFWKLIVSIFTVKSDPLQKAVDRKHVANFADLDAKLDRLIQLAEDQEKRHFGELDFNRKKERQAQMDKNRHI